mgnify:FL=1
MREYQKILGKNNPLQNQLALALLLEKGRENILNDTFYNAMLKGVEEKPSSFMTVDFQKEYIKISRDMASMKSNDIYDFIKNEVNITKNRNKER